MSPPTPLLVGQATQVYGLSIPNPEAATLTRKVIRISVLLLILQVTFSFYNTFSLGQSDFISGAFLSFLIPLCGYCEFFPLFFLFVFVFLLSSFFRLSVSSCGASPARTAAEWSRGSTNFRGGLAGWKTGRERSERALVRRMR